MLFARALPPWPFTFTRALQLALGVISLAYYLRTRRRPHGRVAVA